MIERIPAAARNSNNTCSCIRVDPSGTFQSAEAINIPASAPPLAERIALWTMTPIFGLFAAGVSDECPQKSKPLTSP